MKNLVPEDRPSWSARLSELFTGPPKTTKTPSKSTRASKADPDPGPAQAPAELIPPEKRKAAMKTLDDTEWKWSLGVLILAAVAAITFPAIFTAENTVTKHGKNSISVAPDAWLLGGAILLFCVLGFLALWKRKRTLMSFDLILVGFAFTPFIQLGGFIFIFLGGWLLLRAWRINRWGTTNSKLIAQEARAQPRGRDRKQAARTGAGKGSATTPASGTGDRKQPTASKRYTPKSPPRKKIPKPVAKPGE